MNVSYNNLQKNIIFAKKRDIMLTEDQKQALRENLMGKSVRELIETILECYDELDEAKQIRRRFMQIKNLLKDPEERSKPGRPRKDI